MIDQEYYNSLEAPLFADQRIPVVWLFLLFWLLSFCGCSLPARPDAAVQMAELLVSEDTTWQGRVVVNGLVEVQRGATLTILPGTEVAFVKLDADGDRLGDSGMQVHGSLIAAGTRQQPILFRSSAKDARPGDWKEIRTDFAGEVVLRYCELRDAVVGLHAHYTAGVIENSRFRNNIDALRFGEATFAIGNNLFEQNRARGILTRQSRLQISKNIFRNNGNAIFFMEQDRGSTIEENNFYANRFHFRIGDFSSAEVRPQNNWLGSNDPALWRKKIYDQRQDPELGHIDPAPAARWRSGTGPEDSLEFREAWRFPTDGFIDASPLVVGEQLYAASWDGHLYALNRHGELIWKQNVAAEVDASPVAAGDKLFVQTWQREALALSLADGTEQWRFRYPESPADDHRQGALLPLGENILLPAWGGWLYALDISNGAPRWQLPGHLPLRAAPVVAAAQIYLAAGDGTFSAISLSGKQIWSVNLAAPALTSAALSPEGPVVVARNGQLSAFDVLGNLRWQRYLNERCYYSAPNYHAGAIYLATASGSLWKLDASSGRTIWQHTGLGAFYGSSLIVGKRLFIGNNRGRLYAINIDSGERLATFRAERDIQTTPSMFFQSLVFGSRDGNLYALDLLESGPQEDSTE